MGKNKNAGKPRNYALECGVYRFGKGKMYHKKAIYKFNKKAAPVKVRPVLDLFNLRIIFWPEPSVLKFTSISFRYKSFRNLNDEA